MNQPETKQNDETNELLRSNTLVARPKECRNEGVSLSILVNATWKHNVPILLYVRNMIADQDKPRMKSVPCLVGVITQVCTSERPPFPPY